MTYKVLIVDDDLDIRDLVENILSMYLVDRGTFEFTHAADGLEALNACFERKYDLIFCDIKMPRMDGLSFLQALRQIESPNTSTWAIIFSGYIEVVDAGRGKALDQSYLLQKPFTQKSMGLALDIWMAACLREQRSFTA